MGTPSKRLLDPRDPLEVQVPSPADVNVRNFLNPTFISGFNKSVFSETVSGLSPVGLRSTVVINR